MGAGLGKIQKEGVKLTLDNTYEKISAYYSLLYFVEKYIVELFH